MIKFETLVCAEKVIKSDNNSYSAINILEDIVAETYPTFLQNMSILLIASKAETDASSIELIFEISLEGNVIFTQDRVTVPFLDKSKANVAFNVSNIPINTPGRLTFKFSYETDLVEYSINMKLRENPIISESTIS